MYGRSRHGLARATTFRAGRRAGVCLLVWAALGAFGAAGARSAAGRSSSAEEAAVFQRLNDARRRSGRALVHWDPVSYAVLKETARAWAEGGRPPSDTVNAEIARRRGNETAWVYRLRGRSSAAEAAAAVLEERDLLDAEYSSGSVAVVESAPGTDPPTVVAAAYLCRLVPYLPDVKGSLHWATWFVQPWAPFNTTNPFLAWQWANQRVRYDHPKADHDLPGWQTPQETQALETGVCRDTAVFLGAWLAHMGKDFRVVTGLMDDKDPHAWVVLFDGETKYLLETAMDGDMSRRYPPRLELATRYLPTEMMFDSGSVWLNRGQQRVRDYRSESVWAATREEAP
jgi:hypothetical protein